MLTVKQALMVNTLNRLPPWKVSSLSRWSSTKPLSVRSAIGKLESRTVFFCLQIRDTAILPSLKANANNPELLRKIWASAQPSKETLVKFSSVFNVVHVTGDWRTVVIAGTLGSLAAIPVGQVPNLKGV
jgi:hypothetical protein